MNLKRISSYISYMFHPILAPIVGSLFYFIIIPNHIPKEFAYTVLSIIFIATYLIPILLLLFLKKIKLIDSLKMPTINERKFPVLFFFILSLLLGKLLLKSSNVDLLAFSFFGCALALGIVYLLFFNHVKTSLHSMGVAGLIGFVSVISYEYKLNNLLLLILLFLLFGFVGTSRLKLKAHTMSEIFIGFAIGFFSQIAIYFTFGSI